MPPHRPATGDNYKLAEQPDSPCSGIKTMQLHECEMRKIYFSPELGACWRVQSLKDAACWPCARPGDESRRANPCRSTLQTTPPHQRRPAAGSREDSARNQVRWQEMMLLLWWSHDVKILHLCSTWKIMDILFQCFSTFFERRHILYTGKLLQHTTNQRTKVTK